MTCSALTAGVMALGVALGEIERSRVRVLRMIGTMAAGGDAFADDLNKFNRTMNLGQQLAKWFIGSARSTQCRGITGCDFSTTVGVNQCIDTDGVALRSTRVQMRTSDDQVAAVKWIWLRYCGLQ